MAAALKEPSHRHAVAHLQGLDAFADLNDHADTLVAEDAAGHLTEVAQGHVKVGVAHARILNLHERLAVTHGRDGNLTNLNRAINLLGNNNSLHGFLAHDLKLLSHW